MFMWQFNHKLNLYIYLYCGVEDSEEVFGNIWIIILFGPYLDN